ncbi:MAG TPA: energy transducer TonB [Roseobacter sp.]|uniref:TonB C-terminal domain-containing protein n=1 Tax=marine sediment metagenome TaxID=412755 RepID=A0A0F9T8S6_9ZZZZ|nr:energy transducer TonB [Roseobacter sp.]
MKNAFEFLAFLGAATALHLSVGYLGTGTDMPAGEAGEAAVTLTAATASAQTMVAQWDRKPELVQRVVIPVPDGDDTPAPSFSHSDSYLPSPRAAMPITEHTSQTLPQIDRSVPKPPQPELAKARPQPRPLLAKPPASQERRKALRKTAAPKTAAPKTAAAKTSQGDKPQKAAGTGAGKSKGTSSTGAAPGKKQTSSPKLMAQWGGGIRASIERRKRYPTGTRAKGIVTLSIAVHNSGTVAAISVRRSSGVAQIDRAAVDAVKSARIPAAPAGVTAGRYNFTLPMKFAP